eukprot:scaffold517_cov255-Pinguiococcus_pyrenoidosus.AAC.35
MALPGCIAEMSSRSSERFVSLRATSAAPELPVSRETVEEMTTFATLPQVPAYGVYFWTYDGMKASFQKLGNLGEWPSSFLAGGISGSFTWAIVYPVDVIKSLVQTAPRGRWIESPSWCDWWKRPGSQDGCCAGEDTRIAVLTARIFQQRGWSYFFRGFGTACLRAFPVNAVIFPVYELTLKVLLAASSRPSPSPAAVPPEDAAGVVDFADQRVL